MPSAAMPAAVVLARAQFAFTIAFHIVLPAFSIGTWLIFFSRKGSPLHRVFGMTYLALTTVTAITTLFVHQIWPDSPFWGFSPVHLLIPLTLFGVVAALKGAWTHDIPMHRTAMLSFYIGGMLIAGAATMLPGRIMHAVFLGH